jgi:hypothetical protein
VRQSALRRHHRDNADEAVGFVDEALNGACSFSAETPVATTEGAVAIGEIQVGDKVLAYDEATRATGSYAVTAVLVHQDPAIEYLTIDGERIETTPEYPFFVLLRGWIAAGELQVGDSVRQADGGYGVVQVVAVEQRPQVMYNLTVATAHLLCGRRPLVGA